MMSARKKPSKAEREDDLVFKALAGSDRRRILDLLRDGPRTTSDIGKHLPYLDRTTVMQHLGVLERARLVFSKKEGRSRWNYLDVSPVQRIHERWIGAYASPASSVLDQLRENLETAD